MQKKSLNYFKPYIIFVMIISIYSSLIANELNYDYAVKWARDGDISRSLQEFKTLHQQHPTNLNLIYDYITILGWGNNDNEAITLSKKIDLNQAPDYVLQNIAKSARNIKKFDDAITLYTLGTEKFPNNHHFYIGLALSSHDHKKIELSNVTLQHAKEKFSHDNKILYAIANAYEYNKNYFDAFRIYQDLINDPALKDKSLMKLVGVLKHLGMPFIAQKYINENPNLFDKETVMAIRSDKATFKLRWGAKGYHAKKDRSLLIDVISKIDKNMLAFDLSKSETLQNKHVQNMIFDKIVALNELARTNDAIKLYENFNKLDLKFPSYVLNAIGNAYLAQKQPKKAEKILLLSLKKNPHNFKTKILLFYAYSDGSDMHKALSYAQKLDNEELPKIWDKNHLYRITNPRKLDATVLRILSYEYAGYMGKAEAELIALVENAPTNSWLRSILAKLYYYRGWYERADQEYTILLHQDPDDFGAKEGKFLLFLAQREYRKAYRYLETLEQVYPQKSTELKVLYKTFHSTSKGSFSVQSGFGDTPTQSNIGNSTGYNVSGYLYSGLIDYNYRMFVYAQKTHEKLYGKKSDNSRYGLGVNYRNKLLEANLLLAYNATNIKRIAPSADVTFYLNDYITIGTGYEVFSSQTPLRAIMEGTRMERFFATVSYRHSESRDSSITFEQMDFTDGNMRHSIGLRHFENIIEGPYYNLNAYLYAGGTKNSESDAVYYNPKEDAYISISGNNIWNIYKDYDFNIQQTLGIEIGSHWEKEYGSNSTGVISLGQEWSLNENFGFDFGYMRKRSSYDGNIEYKNEFFLNLHGRF